NNVSDSNTSFLDDLFRGLLTFTEGEPKPYSAHDIVQNFSLILACPPSQRTELWPEVLAELRSDGIQIPEGRWETYVDFLNYLDEKGIHFTYRFRSLLTSLTLLDN